jgi:hypothetical protein
VGFTQCKRNYAYIGCEYLLLLCQLVQSCFLSTSAFLTGSYQFEISLIYFLPNLHIGLPDLFNECKGLGLWLWAPGELSSLIFCYCHLCHLHGIAIILSKLFHCRLVETVGQDCLTVRYAVNQSETVSGCSPGDRELMKYVWMGAVFLSQSLPPHLPHPNIN